MTLTATLAWHKNTTYVANETRTIHMELFGHRSHTEEDMLAYRLICNAALIGSTMCTLLWNWALTTGTLNSDYTEKVDYHPRRLTDSVDRWIEAYDTTENKVRKTVKRVCCGCRQ